MAGGGRGRPEGVALVDPLLHVVISKPRVEENEDGRDQYLRVWHWSIFCCTSSATDSLSRCRRTYRCHHTHKQHTAGPGSGSSRQSSKHHTAGLVSSSSISTTG